jgi:DNA-binding MarR family transcriptional regulator
MGAAKSPNERGDEGDRILDNLRRIVHMLYGHTRRVERLASLTSAQAWLITTLSRMETAKVFDLACSMHLSPSAVVRIVDRLKERGLVVRTRSSNDHGTVKVALTHVGMKLAGRIPPVPQELLLKGLSEVPPDRLRAVSEVLESLVGIMGARELTPLLFFAPVANLPAGDSVGWQRMEQAFPGADMILGRGGTATDDETRERGRVMIRKTYIRKVEDRLERLEDDIDHLRKRMATPVSDFRDRIDQEIRDLRVKAEVVKKSIRAVEAAEASNWGHLKNAVEEGLKELGQAVYEAVERFRKTGSGDH